MKIQFTNPDMNEFFEGGIHLKKADEPFEVDPAIGQSLIARSICELSSGQHDDEPLTIERLAKMKREDLEKIAQEAGLDGGSYANKTELAEAILNANKGDE